MSSNSDSDSSSSSSSSRGSSMNDYEMKETKEAKVEVSSVHSTHSSDNGSEKSSKSNEKKSKKPKVLEPNTIEVKESPLSQSHRKLTISNNGLIPMQIHFDIKSFKVKNTKKKKKNQTDYSEYKTLLQDMKATFEPGTITAIMGSSGAGKTTLLNVLADRVKGKLDGDVLLNGIKREHAKHLTNHSCYVMQDDIMMATQTPKEILNFSANLRLPESVSSEERSRVVSSLIDELNINNCQDTQVGAAGVKRGISGGERKRVAIGVELVTNPSLLFLDEPTSGLDSFTAEHVIGTLRELARAGRTIICTIHQPNSQIFHMFDNLMLLAKGHIIYYGPANQSVDYFNRIGYEVPRFTNPSDHYMSLIHIEQSNAESSQRVDNLIESYKNSDFAKEVESKSKVVPIAYEKKKKSFKNSSKHISTTDLTTTDSVNNSNNDNSNQATRGYERSIFFQMLHLMLRNFKDLFRSPLRLRAAMGQNIFLAVLIGLIYLRLDNDQGSVQDKTGALFFIIVNQAMGSIIAVANTFPAEKTVVFREHSNHMYSIVAYYLSKLASDLPFQCLFPTVFGSIVYWMIGLNSNATNFFTFIALLILISNVGAGVGLVLSVVAPDSSVAIALVPVTVIPFMIFSGFLVNTDSVPVYFIWVPYISFIKWAFEAIIINEFTDLQLTCNEDQKISGVCRIPDGNAVIDSLNFDSASVSTSALVLLGMFVFWRVVAFIILFLKARNQRSNA